MAPAPSFAKAQDQLDELIAMPRNLPVVYLLGDTGAGKTCVVRQFLGTTDERVPPARSLRTTVAPTEFVITNESELKAAFVFRPVTEISRNVTEILQKAIFAAVVASEDGAESENVADLLGDSPDERFRLRCFLSEEARLNLAALIQRDLALRVRRRANEWAASDPGITSEDRRTIIELIIEDELRADVERLRDEILAQIRDRVQSICENKTAGMFPETFCFSSTEKSEFVERLKGFLGVEEGAISPVIERARVRGSLRSGHIPDGAEIVIIDGEGIGHDVREARILSARHFDYFAISDAIILVENAERPFTSGGKSAIAGIAKHGYLPKFYLAFSRLDRVESEPSDREHQKRQVDKGLRNALNALKEEDLHLDKHDLRVRYFSNMNNPEPDEATCEELRQLVKEILKRHGEPKARFVVPVFDYELLSGFLVNAMTEFRKAWQGYTQSGAWQTHRAFAYRMSWKQDEFRWLKPVAEFTDCLVTSLRPFLSNPLRWSEEVTEAHRKECTERLMREISQQVLQFVRDAVLEHEHSNWSDAAELRGTGTTRTMRRMIRDTIFNAAPELTGQHAKKFKDAVKSIVEGSVVACER